MTDKYDLIIVGAGILGLSCAYHLKKNNPNESVLVVDKFADVGQGNSARSNAMFRNTFTSKDNLILSDASIDFYLDTQKSGIDLGLKKTGYLWVMDEKQLSANRRYTDEMRDNQIEIDMLDKQELKKRLPSLVAEFDASDDEVRLMKLGDVAGAVFGVKCGRLDPAKLTRFYASAFVSLGGQVSLNTNVKSLISSAEEPIGIDGEPFVWQDGRVTGVHAEGSINGDIYAETVVIAAGVWNNELLDPLGIDGHVKAKKRQIFTIPAKSTALKSLMHNPNFSEQRVLPFVILPKSGCYIKAVDEEGEFWVACEDEFNRPYFNTPERTLDDLKAEPDYYQKNVYPIVRKYFPEFENLAPANMWAGYYSMNTVDSIPFLFAQNGMLICGGGSGSGIMKGDSMGRLVDAMYREGEHAEAVLYPDRRYPIDKLSFRYRNVEREDWVI